MPTPPAGPTDTARVTSQEIRTVVGEVEDATVAALLALGLTYAELELAAKHATGNSEELGKPPRPLQGRAAEACDILLGDPAFEPVERDR